MKRKQQRTDNNSNSRTRTANMHWHLHRYQYHHHHHHRCHQHAATRPTHRKMFPSIRLQPHKPNRFGSHECEIGRTTTIYHFSCLSLSNRHVFISFSLAPFATVCECLPCIRFMLKRFFSVFFFFRWLSASILSVQLRLHSLFRFASFVHNRDVSIYICVDETK